MSVPIRWIAGLLAAVLLGGIPTLADARAAPDRGDRARITGTLTLDGCSSREVAVLLRAEPFIRLGGREAAGDPTLHRVVNARAVATGERTFSFALDGLAAGRLYRIGLKAIGVRTPDGLEYPPNPCGEFVWEGLPGSVAVAGGTPLSLTGAAVRGSLRAQNLGRRDGEAWSRAGVFALDGDPDSPLRLRWTPPPGATRGVLQVSLERFDRQLGRAACVEPEGLLHRVEIDLRRADALEDGSFELPAVQLDEIVVPPAGTRMDPDGNPVPGPGRPPTVSETEYTKLMLGKPLYVRVVPVDEEGPRCSRATAGLPPWVLLVMATVVQKPAGPYAPPVDKLVVADYLSHYLPPVVHQYPSMSWKCMRTTKWHWLPKPFEGPAFEIEANVALANYLQKWNVMVPPGERFCWPPKGSGSGSGGYFFIDALTELAGGVISTFEQLVDGIASMWKAVKVYTVNSVASVVGTLFNCNSTCKEVIATGIEIGLVAAGIPPTIPNFEQLKQQGLDYVAAQIASQTGLPPELVEYAVNHGYKALAANILNHMSVQRGSLENPFVDWAVEDYGIEPAALRLWVNRTEKGLIPTYLWLPGNKVFAPATVPVPAIFLDSSGKPGGNSMWFNIALHPNFAGWKAPEYFNYKYTEWVCNADHSECKTVTKVGALPYNDHQKMVLAKDYWEMQIAKYRCVPHMVVRSAVYFPSGDPTGSGIPGLIVDPVVAYPAVPVDWLIMVPLKHLQPNPYC